MYGISSGDLYLVSQKAPLFCIQSNCIDARGLGTPMKEQTFKSTPAGLWTASLRVRWREVDWHRTWHKSFLLFMLLDFFQLPYSNLHFDRVLQMYFTFMLPCIVTDFCLNNQPVALIIPILFCYIILHVLGIFSAHHQQFYTVHSALVSFMQVSDDRFQAESGWNCSSILTLLGRGHQ